MNNLIAFWSIFKKDLKTYYFKGPNINWGILFPISWALMQLFSKKPSSMLETLPGLIAMSVLFGSTSLLAVTITFERSTRTFERILLAPMSLSVMLLSKLTSAILFGFVVAAVPIAFTAFFVSLEGINWGMLLASALLVAITSSMLALLISIPAHAVHEAMAHTNMLRFPMIFLCGLFFPISSLPVFLRPISYALPLTYGEDLINNAVAGSGALPPLLCFGALIGFSLLLFALCALRIKRKWLR